MQALELQALQVHPRQVPQEQQEQLVLLEPQELQVQLVLLEPLEQLVQQGQSELAQLVLQVQLELMEPLVLLEPQEQQEQLVLLELLVLRELQVQLERL